MTILIGDVRDCLATLPERSVHCCVTSPPYWGLRDYGVAGQIGSESSPEEYVATMVDVFRAVRRVLRDDGTLWLNLGDCYSSGGRKTRNPDRINPPIGDAPRPLSGLPGKNLLGMPWRVAFALQADGWYLRSDIIWHKANPMPLSVTDRPSTAHEYVFLLSKRADYYYDNVAVMEPISTKTLTVATTPRKGSGMESTGEKLNHWMAANGGRYHPETRNLRSVWKIASAPYKGAHFATFPPKLIEPCILAGTSEHGCCPSCGAPWRRQIARERVPTRPGNNSKVYADPEGSPHERHSGTIVGNRDPLRHVTRIVTTGWVPGCQCIDVDTLNSIPEPVPCVVLDPFLGSATMAMVAEHYGRLWIGCELNPDYAEQAKERIAAGYRPSKPRRAKAGARPMERSLFSGIEEIDDAYEEKALHDERRRSRTS